MRILHHAPGTPAPWAIHAPDTRMAIFVSAMNHPLKHLVAILAPHLPRWIYLACGMTIIALALLVKPWLDCRQLMWQKEVMAQQSDRLASRSRAYQQFHTAVVNDDPVLLEHLAYHQLSLKPIGATMLTASSPDAPHPADRWALGMLLAQEEHPPKHSPLPGRNEPMPPDRPHAWQPINSRLIRLTTGPARLPLIAAGVLCLAAGMWSSLGPQRGDE
jgi:hypothetical protein